MRFPWGMQAAGLTTYTRYDPMAIICAIRECEDRVAMMLTSTKAAKKFRG